MAASKREDKRKGDVSATHSKKKPKIQDDDKTRSAQKRELRKERQSKRRHADVVDDSKAIWNKLRMKNNTEEETETMVNKLMEMIEGKVSEIALQHDASRVVQAAIQFGNKEQRKLILKELCAAEGSLPEIAKIQYAHFCCLKLIKYCHTDNECAKDIVKAFKGHMPKLAVHTVAARVVESLFLNMSPQLTSPLKQEFYGPHFSLFAADKRKEGQPLPTLKSNLEKATDNQKESAISFVKSIVSKGVTKAFFGYSFFQDLFCEYAEVADSSDLRALIPGVADHAVHMLSTRPGAKAVATCASYGTPKDRKRLLKSLKGYTRSSLMHRDAYLAMIRMVQVMDDTVSVHKSLLNEILTSATEASKEADAEEVSPLLELALSENSSKLFLFLLPEDDETRMKYFDPVEREILEQSTTVRENGKDVQTSKKDPAQRRKELLAYLKEALIELCTNHPEELICSIPGARVLKEVYALWSPDQVVSAIVDMCLASRDAQNEEDKKDSTSIFEHHIGHRAIKNMVLVDSEKKSGDGEPAFSIALLEKLGDSLVDVSTSNRGAFVVTALCKVPSLRTKVIAKLKPGTKKLKQLSKGKGTTAGFTAILKEIS